MLALAVDEVVGVAEARHVARQLVARHGLQRDVLVVDRRRRDERADHRGDLRRPHAGRVDDELRVDRAGVGQHALDLAPWTPSSNPVTRRPRPDPDAQRPGGIGERMRRRVRVEMAVAGQVDRTVERVGEMAGISRRASSGPMTSASSPMPRARLARPLELTELLRR